MGRLPLVAPPAWHALAIAIASAAVPLAAGCDQGTPAGSSGSRSEQVIATGSMPTAAPRASTDSPHAAPTATPRKLCAGDGNAHGRIVPKTPPAHVEATGAPPLPPGVPLAHAGWTWINFWAAWCAPCKEEMPRLLAWQNRLAKASIPLRVAFVSLDDDERQIEGFLAQQPADGVRASYWLADGPARTAWLSSLKMKSSPELPEHALVDPTGHVRCFIEGAIEEGDYDEIAALVGR
jgi:thiol-disulfide isomerase/thioredoxin